MRDVAVRLVASLTLVSFLGCKTVNVQPSTNEPVGPFPSNAASLTAVVDGVIYVTRTARVSLGESVDDSDEVRSIAKALEDTHIFRTVLTSDDAGALENHLARVRFRQELVVDDEAGGVAAGVGKMFGIIFSVFLLSPVLTFTEELEVDGVFEVDYPDGETASFRATTSGASEFNLLVYPGARRQLFYEARKENFKALLRQMRAAHDVKDGTNAALN